MKENLIIFRSGANSLHHYWLPKENNGSYDVFICPYQPVAVHEDRSDLKLGEIVAGAKIGGLRQLLTGWNGWREYKYVMLADDDLLMSSDNVSRFFSLCRVLKARLAQPALTIDSPSGHQIVYQNSYFSHRWTTFVEIMSPCFEVETLSELLWTFDLTKSGWGWGLDYLWPKLLGYEDVFVIDSTPMLHARPVGSSRDTESNRTLWAEELEIVRRFSCSRDKKTLAAVTLQGRRIEKNDPRLLHGLLRGYETLFEKRPHLLIDFLREQLKTTR